MKKLIYILAIVFAVISCKNDDDNLTPLEQLPPATQTGEGTFGCLVNGEAFVETGTFFNCFYQLVNGEYYFSISAENNNNDLLDLIRLASEEAQIENATQYNLECNEPNSYYAEVAFTGLLLSEDTCASNFGSLSITKLDFNNNIVSGTFDFDIINPNDNSIIEIRNGRFDTIFTQ